MRTLQQRSRIQQRPASSPVSHPLPQLGHQQTQYPIPEQDMEQYPASNTTTTTTTTATAAGPPRPTLNAKDILPGCGSEKWKKAVVEAGGTSKPENVGRLYATCWGCKIQEANGRSAGGGFIFLDEEHLGYIPCKGTEAATQYWAWKKGGRLPTKHPKIGLPASAIQLQPEETSPSFHQQQSQANFSPDPVQRARSLNQVQTIIQDPTSLLWNSPHTILMNYIERNTDWRDQGLEDFEIRDAIGANARKICDIVLQTLTKTLYGDEEQLEETQAVAVAADANTVEGGEEGDENFEYDDM